MRAMAVGWKVRRNSANRAGFPVAPEPILPSAFQFVGKDYQE